MPVREFDCLRFGTAMAQTLSEMLDSKGFGESTSLRVKVWERQVRGSPGERQKMLWFERREPIQIDVCRVQAEGHFRCHWGDIAAATGNLSTGQ
jgi:hypothetical protein